MKRMFAALALACLTLSAVAVDAIKVVYHMSEGTQQASRGLENIRNHLAADPSAKIVVVAHGPGIDFLLEDAVDAKGLPFAGKVGDLANQGVEFRVCNNTLEGRGIPRDKVALEAQVVPSGVAEIAKLQATQGFVYLRP